MQVATLRSIPKFTLSSSEYSSSEYVSFMLKSTTFNRLHRPTAFLFTRILQRSNTRLAAPWFPSSSLSTSSGAMDKPPAQQPNAEKDMKSTEKQWDETKVERKIKQPPPPQNSVRAFMDRQATTVMKALGVI